MTARTLIASESALSDLPDRIVVAPAFGRVELPPPETFTTEGELVRGGAPLARLTSDGEIVVVRAPCDAWVVAYLVRHAERVAPGDPICHLRAL